MLRYLLLLVLLCSVGSSSAADALIYKDGSGNSLTLVGGPCEAEKVKQALVRAGFPGLERNLRTATMVFRGRTYEACWALIEGSILVMDEQAETVTVPLSVFRPLDSS